MFATLPASSVLAEGQGAYFYRDSHVRRLARENVSCDELVNAFFHALPPWVDTLMKWRDGLVERLGLKTSASAPHEALAQGPIKLGQQIGVFRVLALAPGEVVLGENDRHLDFRVSLMAGQSEFRVSTLVRPHNVFGWFYLACVLPFHHFISALSTSRVARLLNAGSYRQEKSQNP
ncbi:MAG: DUF2867 domain-containing protein [Betaproteobacteria bacterium]|nr:DUF2867 domain-containing protein [Betaproteobacteria bacterium]